MALLSLFRRRDLVPTIDGIPVLLPAHCDTFDKPGRHFHVDFRYLDEPPRQDRTIFTDAEPVYRRLPKLRDTYRIDMRALNLPVLMAQRYAGRRAVCGKCPHQGLPVMRGQCVGHGLMFEPDGEVTQDFLLHVGRSSQPPILRQKQYVFVFQKKEMVDRVELRTAWDDRLVSAIQFKEPIFVIPPQTITITVK